MKPARKFRQKRNASQHSTAALSPHERRMQAAATEKAMQDFLSKGGEVTVLRPVIRALPFSLADVCDMLAVENSAE